MKNANNKKQLLMASMVLAAIAGLVFPKTASAQAALTNGVPRVINSWPIRTYHIDVPDNVTQLRIAISGGGGDANLWFRAPGNPPSPAGIRPNNNEWITIPDPREGRWQIRCETGGIGWYNNVRLVANFRQRQGPNTGAVIAHVAPSIIEGLCHIAASRGDDDDDDDEDDDEDEDEDEDDDADDDENEDLAGEESNGNGNNAVVAGHETVIADRMDILTPAQNSVIRPGSTYTVTWQVPENVSRIMLEVSWDTAKTWSRLSTLPARTPGFVWYIPSDQEIPGKVLLRISDCDSPESAARILAIAN